jgi:hypothetical protein
MSNIIILRSVYGKVEQVYTLNPCIDPATGMYPTHVKTVDTHGDMILSDKDKASGTLFIPNTEVVDVVDGFAFNLDIPVQKARWEAVKHSKLIAPERHAHDREGNLLIDGSKNKFGLAVLYIERPGEESKVKVSRKKIITEACNYIFKDSKEGQITKCKLLGKNMANAYPSDVEDFLISYAERFPNKIIDLYNGTDTENRMLLIDALTKGVIIQKDGLYMYGDKIALGISDDSAVMWLKQESNVKFKDLIMKDTYPELYKEEKPKK